MSDVSWYRRRLAAHQQPQARAYPQPQPHTQVSPQAVPTQQPTVGGPRPGLPVTLENLYEMAGHWHGGMAHRLDTQPCPQCGSNQFFSRAHTARRGPPPAPHCYNCGYNGLFEQGDIATWEGG